MHSFHLCLKLQQTDFNHLEHTIWIPFFDEISQLSSKNNCTYVGKMYYVVYIGDLFDLGKTNLFNLKKNTVFC